MQRGIICVCVYMQDFWDSPTACGFQLWRTVFVAIWVEICWLRFFPRSWVDRHVALEIIARSNMQTAGVWTLVLMWNTRDVFTVVIMGQYSVPLDDAFMNIHDITILWACPWDLEQTNETENISARAVNNFGKVMHV